MKEYDLQERSLEFMDDGRNFYEYLPVPKMPKSFLLSGKRKEETMVSMTEQELHDEDDTSDDEMTTKRHRFQSESTDDDASMSSHVSHAFFRPSEESAFSKIGRVESDDSKVKCSTNLPPTSANNPLSGIYPAFYSPMFTYPIIPPTTETGTGSSPAFLGSYLYPPLQVPGLTEKSATSPETSPQADKNMFYYVDPRIPFTNYFLNLTKLLKSSSSSKEESTTTPLGKMAGEEKRASDTEPPFTPESQNSSPEKFHSPDTSFSSFSSKSSPELGETTKRADLKIDVSHDRMTFPHFLDPHVQTPMAGNLLHHTHPQTVVPLHSGGIFHPALMSLPGTSGFRRYNPEKPPPVKKYKCDVCGKAFSRSNTLVTHKRIHTGDKPFKCEICSRAFRQPGNLTRHRLTHTTVKPYVCPTCNKAFNRASNLHTHMRTHTSFKSYICPYCGKGFHQKIDMKIHCYTHTAHTARLEAQ